MILTASLLFAAQEQINPAQLAGLMLKRYAEAKTLTGTIELTSSIPNSSLTVSTKISYERPSKIYLSQWKTGQDNAKGLVTSDGNLFSYDAPMQLKPTQNERLMEFVKKPDETATLGRIAQIGQQRLPDYTAPLWILMGYLPNLKSLRATWADIKVIDSNESLVRIGGNYREDELGVPSGTWNMDVTREGDLKRYCIITTIVLPISEPDKPVRYSPPITVTNIWTINATINSPIDPKVFTVVR